MCTFNRAELLPRAIESLAGQTLGPERFEILVGAAVLANNLMRIAELLRSKKKTPRAAAA